MTVRSVLPALLVVCGLRSVRKRGKYPEPEKVNCFPSPLCRQTCRRYPSQSHCCLVCFRHAIAILLELVEIRSQVGQTSQETLGRKRRVAGNLLSITRIRRDSATYAFVNPLCRSRDGRRSAVAKMSWMEPENSLRGRLKRAQDGHQKLPNEAAERRRIANH